MCIENDLDAICMFITTKVKENTIIFAYYGVKVI